MTKNLLIAFLCLLSLGAFAQRKCGSYEYLQKQLAADPKMALRMQEIERFTKDRPVMEDGLRGTPVYTIPVVVHVLWNTSIQNISDAQILSQIDVLNKDYQLNNSDTTLIPTAFKSFVADCKIQFCMAQRDPSGNATTGIFRKQTTKTSFSADTDDAKSNSTGGSTTWDATKYLNIWIVPEITSGGSGGILGYAQFPGGAAATDGVVIGYKYFGTSGTAVAPFNKGRTATHEVGHWLNLRHIWGDEPNCSQDDLVGDTPLQADKNFGCPSFPKVDACTSGNGVMFMNYMDYTDDACMYMFTTGQKNRMYGVLQTGGFRASLATSNGCQPPAGGTCTAPTGLAASSVTTSSANVSWTAVSGAVSYTVQYKTSASSTWITAASATTATSVSLTGLTASTTYNWQVLTNCSSSSSAYTASSFTTSAASGCGSAYEPNESLSAAASVATNTALSAAITTTTDKDWFKFTLGATSNLNITLSNLAGDYDIILYNSAGTEIKRSENGGTTSETMTTSSSAAGTYYIQVFGYNGANSATCYSLNIGATAVATSCASSYDNTTNGTMSGAALIPKNTDIKGLISPSGEIDYYKFTIATGGTITITLGTLPGDYDVKLHNSAGTQVGISQNGGTTSETINYTAAAGTYYVQVYGYNGANSSTTCYTLRVATGTATRTQLPVTVGGKGKLSIFPNPATNVVYVDAGFDVSGGTVTVTDAQGRVVHSQKVSGNKTTINTERFANGMYQVQMRAIDGTIISQSKLVKQ